MKHYKLLKKAIFLLTMLAVFFCMPVWNHAEAAPAYTLDASSGSAKKTMSQFKSVDNTTFANSQMLLKTGEAGVYRLDMTCNDGAGFYTFSVYDAKGNVADIDLHQIKSDDPYYEFDSFYMTLKANSSYYMSWYIEADYMPVSITASLKYLANCGNVGPNIKSSYNASSKTLTLKGSGSTWDALDMIVWDTRFIWNTSGPIEHVVIGEGIERIGTGMFFNQYDLKTIQFPSTLKSIGYGAFMRKYYSDVENVTPYTYNALPLGLRTLEDWALLDEYKDYPAEKKTDIELPVTVNELGDNVWSWAMSRIRLVSASLKVKEYAKENGIAFKEVAGAMSFKGAKKTGDYAYEITLTAGDTLTYSDKVLFNGSLMPYGKTYDDSYYYVVGPSIRTSDGSYVDPKPYAVWDSEYEKLTLKAPGAVYLSFNSHEFGGHEMNEYGFSLKIIIKPSSTSISSLTNTSSGIKLAWKSVSNASGYLVYRSKGSGDYSLIKTITSKSTVSYTDTGATSNGTKYRYKVVAYKSVNGTKYKASASAVKTMYRLSRPTIASAKNSSAGKVKVTWKQNSKASGYQVKYVLGTTTKTVSISSNATLSKTISNLKKGKTYKFYVRSYKTVSGKKYYSAWSAVKSVLITK